MKNLLPECSDCHDPKVRVLVATSKILTLQCSACGHVFKAEPTIRIFEEELEVFDDRPTGKKMIMTLEEADEIDGLAESDDGYDDEYGDEPEEDESDE